MSEVKETSSSSSNEDAENLPASETTLNSTSSPSPSHSLPDLSEYCTYVRYLLSEEPRLQRVIKFLDTDDKRSHGQGHSTIEGIIISFQANTGPQVTYHVVHGYSKVEDKLYSVGRKFDDAPEHPPSLQQTIQKPGAVRKVFLCEDLQPHDAKYLGALLGLDPMVLENFINREASFESRNIGSYTFDYAETYYNADLPRSTDERGILLVDDHAQPCTLIRMWKDIYGLYQRIVWVVVFSTEAQAYIHIILTDSLRRPRNMSTTYLGKSLPTFEHYKRFTTRKTWRSCREQLEEALLSTKFDYTEPLVNNGSIEQEMRSSSAIGQVITNFLASKWDLMICQAQESISETKAPLTGELDKIEEVLQRKHDFEKLERILSSVIASIKRLPGFETASHQVSSLISNERSLGNWAVQLEKVSQSMLGLLAIAESRKATQQAVRAKNLQLLAYIFLPISTVSSIYGMNTAEILDHKPRNWYFIVGAVAAIASSCILATFHHSVRAPWFGKAIFNDPWEFLADVSLLLLAFVLKLAVALIVIALIAVILALWVALCVPAAVLLVVFSLLLRALKASDDELQENESGFVGFVYILRMMMVGFLMIPWLWIDEDNQYLIKIAWFFYYTYDIRHPLTIPGETKQRRRWRWTRRDPAPEDTKAKQPEGPECIVM